MKIRRFNKKSLKKKGNGEPVLSVSSGGQINMTRSLVEMLGFKQGQKIEILQDEEQKCAFFLVINQTSDGYTPRQNTSGSFTFNSVALAEQFKEKAGDFKRSVRYLVSKNSIDHNGEELWPIITSYSKPKPV
jgi:hypothetical protein